jgi:hypothetical protein
VTPALLPHTQNGTLPAVLYETLAHPRGTENTFARRMVLASRFHRSSLRLPLSGMDCCEIATRTLDCMFYPSSLSRIERVWLQKRVIHSGAHAKVQSQNREAHPDCSRHLRNMQYAIPFQTAS